MSKLKYIIGLALVAATGLFILPEQSAKAQNVNSTASSSRGQINCTQLNVRNPSDANLAFSVYDNTGTNFVNVSPTNAALQFVYLGVTNTAVLSTNIVVTNATGTRTMQFRNGILIGVQ